MWNKVKGLFVQDENKGSEGDLASSDEVEALLKGLRTSDASTEPTSPEPEAIPPTATVEGRPFGEIYAEAGVPPAKYEAERLLTVIGGLGAMDPATKRQVVAAMEAADGSWTLEDPLADAEAKVRALEAAKRGLAEHIAAENERAAVEQTALDTRLAETRARIAAEIQALDDLLRGEIESIATARAAVGSAQEATRAAATRETVRLDNEITRLGVLATTFRTTTNPNPK